MATTAGDHALEEWQECRTSIGRFDSIIADTRKFGFTLVTGLLTANALVTGTGHATASTLAALIVEALVFALYLLDRYYWVLLREAVNRAEYLEKKNLSPIHLTQFLSHISQATWADRAALAVYIVFMGVAAALPLLLDGPKSSQMWWTFGAGMVLIIAMVGMYFWSVRALRQAALYWVAKGAPHEAPDQARVPKPKAGPPANR